MTTGRKESGFVKIFTPLISDLLILTSLLSDPLNFDHRTILLFDPLNLTLLLFDPLNFDPFTI